MKIFKYNINLRKNSDNTVELDKATYASLVDVNERFQNIRAGLEKREVISQGEVLYPNIPLPYETLYDVSRYSDVLRTIHMALRNEIFRQGYKIKAKFAVKCNNCGKEFPADIDSCDDCGSTDFIKPKTSQKEKLQEFYDRCNDNDQNVLDVLQQVNDDYEAVDEGYLCMIKDYYFSADGSLKMAVPVELLRIDPTRIWIIADETGRPGRNADGKVVRTCLVHRELSHLDKDKCPTCGKQMYPAHFRAKTLGDKDIYYIKDEVLHTSKYRPSLTYGLSPVFSIWMKIVILMNQDNYMRQYYTKQRPPRGLLVIGTNNADSVSKYWSWMLDEYTKNPHVIPPLIIENDKQGGKIAEFIDFMKSPEEMQFTQFREELKRSCGAMYGVMPLFQADVSASGGLNNEGLQITVTNRSVKKGQQIHNDKNFLWVHEQLGITDWVSFLVPSEEQDEVHFYELAGKKMENARKMQDMGFEVTYNEEGDFEFGPTDEPVKKPEQSLPLMQEQPSDSQNFSGQPDSVENSMEKEAVTSSTPGIYNPVHDKRIKELNRVVRKIQDQVLEKNNLVMNDLQKAEGSQKLAEYLHEALFAKSFDGISKANSDLIKEYLTRALLNDYSESRVVKYITQKAGIEPGRASVIFNTETQALQNKVREFTYQKTDPEEKKLYKWIGPDDKRTTKVCKNIVARTSSGVKLSKMREVIEEESKKQGFDPREWTPHPNCRHTFVRVL